MAFLVERCVLVLLLNLILVGKIWNKYDFTPALPYLLYDNLHFSLLCFFTFYIWISIWLAEVLVVMSSFASELDDGYLNCSLLFALYRLINSNAVFFKYIITAKHSEHRSQATCPK